MPEKLGSRALKKEISKLLREKTFEEAMDVICRFPPKQVIGPLFSHFYGDDIVFWRAVSAMGVVVSAMADSGTVESARVVLRRMMWQLNDESGGIGWGCPEAMGEIMARNQRLAEEFHRILASYTMVEGNFLEHPVLQRGLLWGVGRLTHARAGLVSYVAPHLVPFLTSSDPIHRGLAAWALSPIADAHTKALIKALAGDNATVTIYIDDCLIERAVADFARNAMT
ncbi:DVU0298 family protein [Desulfococcus sp.]|uniref:DVU0298 family protein n=1 Tax=Desulfococcus sp. TaxID=2025834 RepID=UPI00359396DB